MICHMVVQGEMVCGTRRCALREEQTVKKKSLENTQYVSERVKRLPEQLYATQ